MDLIHIKEMILNEKKFIENYKYFLFKDYIYQSALKIPSDNEIKICGFIELLNINKENTILFYDDKFNKYFIDDYNKSVFLKNKSKLFKIDHKSENDKKYII